MEELKATWMKRWQLAYQSRGFTIELNQVPDYVVDWIWTWTDEANKHGHNTPPPL